MNGKGVGDEGAVGEFPRSLSVLDVPAKGAHRRLKATAEECSALAPRLGVERVLELSADIEVRPWRSRGVTISGTFDARVEQICVVTLEPFVADVSGVIQARFEQQRDRKDLKREANEIVVDPLDDEEPEPLHGTQIELGELVVEHLILALDPYPRRDGATLPATGDEEGAPEEDGPFAALAALKRSDTGE